MDKPKIKAELRGMLGKKVRFLRKEGRLPAVLYGNDVKNINLSIDQREFEELFKKAGQNTIISLNISEEGKRNVLIHRIERDPVNGRFIHADFYQVKMTEKITTQVPLHFIGESSAVREQDGTLIKNMDHVEVECLPADLPQSIDVDTSVLDDFEAAIHVKDLDIPQGVEVLDSQEETVVTVEPPRSEEELAELEEPVEGEMPEEAEEGREEGEEGTEMPEEAEEGGKEEGKEEQQNQ